jgi:hypothetical protein
MKKLNILPALLLVFVIVVFSASCDLINPIIPDNPQGPGTGPVEPSIPDAPPILHNFSIVVDGNDISRDSETSIPVGYPISVEIGGFTFTNDVPKYAITLKSGGTVVDSIVGTLDNPIAKEQAPFIQLISIHSINTVGSFTAEVYFEDSKGNKSNTLTTAFTVFDGGYVTVWPNPQEKQIDLRGLKTFALLATGNHCDVHYDITVSQPTELLLRRIVFNYDNDYERVTSFLGLYERGGGPGGDGGGDGNPRIQSYIYVLEGADGRVYNRSNNESVHIGINVALMGSVFTHELCHLIFFGYYSSPPDVDNWYVEFLPCMSEGVFYEFIIDWNQPNVELFGGWEMDYYNTYRKLAKFLLDNYGNAIFYDLYHELYSGPGSEIVVNKEALENVLRKRGSTISVMEIEFTAWCDNRGTQS